jgi:hypothetical protein
MSHQTRMRRGIGKQRLALESQRGEEIALYICLSRLDSIFDNIRKLATHFFMNVTCAF